MAGNFEDLGPIVRNIGMKLSKRQAIARLLTYGDSDCLSATRPNIDVELEENTLLGKRIKILPKIDLTQTTESSIVILLPYISANDNDDFSNLSVEIDVVVPIELWPLNDKSCLRPIKIMSEIKKSINKTEVGGLGVLTFVDAALDIPSDEISVYKMIFLVNTNG